MPSIGVGTVSNALTNIGTAAGAAGALLSPDVADAFLGIFGLDRYKQLFKQTESDFKQYGESPTDRRLWKGTTDKSTKDYFFLLKYKDTSIQVPFHIAPQRETFTIPHANTVQQTQGGGKIDFSEGVTYTDIVIQGQCGLYPLNKQAKLPNSGIRSGLESIKFLETLFRRYCFLKRFGDLSENLQLIYVNRRTEDAWVVNPKQFVREDAVEHQNSFSYTIVLETLYPYDGSDAKSIAEQLLSLIPGFDALDGILQTISETVDQLNVAAGAIASIIDGFAANVLGPVNSIAGSYADLQNATLNNLGFSQAATQSAIQNLQSTAAALETAGASPALVNAVINVENALISSLKIDDLYQNTPNQTAISVQNSVQSQAAYWSTPGTGAVVSPSEAQAVGALTTTKATDVQAYEAGINKATITGESSVGTATSVVASPSISITVKAVTPPNPASVLPPSYATALAQFNWNLTAKQILADIDPAKVDFQTAQVAENDDIQTIANKLIGDPAKWPQLVLLNGLQFPYVASQAYIDANPQLKGTVIAYGKPIVFPVPKSSSAQTAKARRWRQETGRSVNLTPFERSLGNDVYIDPNVGDIVWTANDLQLVYSIDNLGQFIRFRMVTKKGTYRRAKRVGFSNYLGLSEGVTTTVVKAEGRGLFFGDNRILSSEVLGVQQIEGVLLVTVAVFVKNLQDPIIQTNRIA
jgi:hypothetical protein